MSSFTKGLKSFVTKLKTVELSEKNINSSLQEFEIFLLKNNVSTAAAREIIQKAKSKILGTRVNRFSNIDALVSGPVKEAVSETMCPSKTIDLVSELEVRKSKQNFNPMVILFLGINGTGKTTAIAKLGYLLSNSGFRLVIAAADTFRAAAQEQIKEHADRLKIKCIEGSYGGDPGAVVFDAIAHAKARSLHAVLIDTAGRMTINHDLIAEMQKIKRVADPDYTFLIADALAGNDATTQAKEFDEKVGIDAVILNKLDADERSGAALSITFAVKGKPIIYVGTGQKYKDLEKFDYTKFTDRLFSI